MIKYMNLFILCVLVRLSLAILVSKLSGTYLKVLGIMTLIPALGFYVIYFTGSRKIGMEVSAEDKKIWWNNLRVIHGSLYLIFSIGAFLGYNLWYILLIDVSLGLGAYLQNYYP
jgi:hypothetical protein